MSNTVLTIRLAVGGRKLVRESSAKAVRSTLSENFHTSTMFRVYSIRRLVSDEIFRAYTKESRDENQ